MEHFDNYFFMEKISGGRKKKYNVLPKLQANLEITYPITTCLLPLLLMFMFGAFQHFNGHLYKPAADLCIYS